MKYLFLLTITPVQDFISQARKLKDLFGGSSILSEMSKVGIEYAKNNGATVIFPQEGDGHNSYPNRFLIEISFESEDELKNFASNVSGKILNYFKNLNKTQSFIVEKHIENFFQIYWSASEYNENYKEAFDEVEKRLAEAKNTRFFTQLGEVGRKCSICGERNVAIYKKPMRFYIKEQRNNLIEANESDNIRKGEGICGVCYIKRKSQTKGFDSTAEIALMNIPKEIRKKYNHLNRDAQLFYEENLNKSFFEKNDIEYPLEECLKEYQSFKEEIKNRYKQSSYYAVIMFDGDDMGKWLSGNKGGLDKSKLETFHKDISLNLSTFAKEAKNILKEPKGMTVYAGGEDFLGFVNINNLFEVLEKLNNEFNHLINEPLRNKYKLTDNFTFSAGVIIAHYKTPLGAVLNEVRKSEKKAKKSSGKDAVCLTVMKRSGEIRETIIKHKNIETLSKILKKLKNDFSDSFIANLEKEFLILLDENGELRLSKSLIISEIERLLKRAKLKEKADIKLMKESISKLYTKEFKYFSDALNIAQFVNREIL